MPKVTKLADYKKKKTFVYNDEFIEAINDIEVSIKELRRLRNYQTALNKTMDILREIKFCGIYNFAYRQMVYEQLNQFLDELHTAIKKLK